MTDTTITAATAQPPLERFPFSFTGKGGEYFGIWIVNLLLTIVTLGIYSAWAKVRKNRYLYGNTRLAGHNFEYHATPMQLLKGRLIAIGALILYMVAQQYSPMASVVLFLLFLIAMPWIIVSSLRFNARMTSYRNVRFDFAGTVGEAAKVFLLYPVLILFTFGLFLPFSAKRSYEFIFDNLRYGGQPFKTGLSLKQFYLFYGMALVLMSALALGFTFTLTTLGSSGAVAMMVMPLVMYAAVIFGGIYFQTMITNYVICSLNLNGEHRFESLMSPARMAWIVISNVIAVALSLGILYPWTVTRTLNYRLSNTAMMSNGDFSAFSSDDYANQKATGEELADVFDVGIGF